MTLNCRSYEQFQEFKLNIKQANPEQGKTKKYDVALTFIKTYVNSNYLNTVPDKSGSTLSSQHGGKKIPVKELPFRTVECFFKEMVSVLRERCPDQKVPGSTTFRTAYENYNSSPRCLCKTRLLRQKGSHATCEVCINCSKLIQENGKRFGNKAKEVIRKYRTEHNEVQAGERDELNRNREKARRQEGAFLFGDFMSEYATKLPHFSYYGNNHSKEDSSNKSIGIRLYGVEVIYGPKIEGIFCYLVPGFIPGGNSYYNKTLFTFEA